MNDAGQKFLHVLPSIEPVSELEPWKSDPPLASPKPNVFWDGDAVPLWPYPVPSLTLADHTTRYQLLMWASDGHPLEPSHLSILLCPRGVAPEKHGILAMQRRGLVHVHYLRHLSEEPLEAFPAPQVRGWKGPEFVYGRKMNKTSWVFVGHTYGSDGVDLAVTLTDDPRRRDRAEVLAMLDAAMRPFRGAHPHA